jgi:ribonuclease HI
MGKHYHVVDNELDIEPDEITKFHKLTCYVDGGFKLVNKRGKSEQRGHYCFVIGTKRYYGKVDEARFIRVTELTRDDFTHNAVEYLALLKLVKKLPSHTQATIYMDSRLVVEQINQNWKITYPHLRHLAEKIWSLCEQKDIKAKFLWVSREDNKAGKYLERCLI